MSHPADHYLKLLIGDLAAQIAILRAENDSLREQLAQRESKPAPEAHLHAV